MPPIKLGANCWNQYADWPNMLAAGQRVDRLGYDTLWTWDHLYPIVGSHEGPIFEGWLAITAWAATTERVRIGLMVGANTFRNPALTAKMATTFDHISGGRAILGIGAAWFETEHRAYGLEYGDGPPERLRWLGEALPIMRGMLHGERPSASGPHYATTDVRNDPPPAPGAPAAAHRRWRRAGHAPAGRPLRGREQRRRGHRNRPEQGTDPPPALRGGRARPIRDRTDDGDRHGRDPRLRGGGATGPPLDLRAQRPRSILGRHRGRDAGTGRRAPGAVPRHRLPTPHRRLPLPLRRGVADAARERGPSAARARIASKPGRDARASVRLRGRDQGAIAARLRPGSGPRSVAPVATSTDHILRSASRCASRSGNSVISSVLPSGAQV